jgi:hypothetical protein
MDDVVAEAIREWGLVEIERTRSEMARFDGWCEELEQALAEPFPRELHTAKGKKGTFVSVHHYVARLNELVGVYGWSMEPPIHYHSGSKLGLAVGVTILGVTKWNVGDEMEDHGEPDEDNIVRDFGSSSTNSWAQGFKRCCAYGFALGLYLYDKDFTKRYLDSRTPTPTRMMPMDNIQRVRIESLMATRQLTAKQYKGMADKLKTPLTSDDAKGYITWLESLPLMEATANA